MIDTESIPLLFLLSGMLFNLFREIKFETIKGLKELERN